MSSKTALLKQHQQLIQEVKQHKYKHSDERWNHYDSEIRRILLECLPNQDSAMSLSERRVFWRNNMGYIYQRYGLKLIKKFEATDQLIRLVRDSLSNLPFPITDELDSLKKDWPVLINLDPYTKEELVRYFEQDERYYLLPAADSIKGDGK